MDLLGVLVVVGVLGGPVLLVWGLVRRSQNREDPADDGATKARKRSRRYIGGVLASIGAAWSTLLMLGAYYVFTTPYSKGRVLRLKGRARVARRAHAPASSWSDDAVMPDTAGLSAWERTVLGEAWLRTAELEHASVPAFSRLALALVAVGAPAELLARTHAAAIDEIDHARRCYALARAYSGTPWAPGELPELMDRDGARIRPRIDDALGRLAVGSLVDGCLAEGTAAAVAQRGAARALDPVVRDTLTTIATDEAVHAELAWDVLRWTLTRDRGRVAPALEAALVTLPDRRAPGAPPIPGVSLEWLAQRGIVLDDDLAQIAGATIERVMTRARALLDEAETSDSLAA